jgi:hypothetical protein
MTDHEGLPYLAPYAGPMVAGSLRGYRSWELRAQLEPTFLSRLFGRSPRVGTVELGSVTMSYTWTPGQNVAQCLASRGLRPNAHGTTGGPPQAKCSCGFYALYDPYHAGEWDNEGVIGSIKAYGRIVIGTRGFRAEKVHLEALCLTPNHCHAYYAKARRKAVKKAASIYGVPFFSGLETMLAAFPSQSVDELIRS